MTDFETAARKAVNEVSEVIAYAIDEGSDIGGERVVVEIFVESDDTDESTVSRYVDLSAKAKELIADVITKHYADLAETFGLLCELAMATKLFVMAHDNLETEKALSRSNYNTDIEDIAYIGKAVAGTELRNLLANPRIAALLAEKKG